MTLMPLALGAQTAVFRTQLARVSSDSRAVEFALRSEELIHQISEHQRLRLAVIWIHCKNVLELSGSEDASALDGLVAGTKRRIDELIGSGYHAFSALARLDD